MSSPVSDVSQVAHLVDRSAGYRFVPEPKTDLGRAFQGALRVAGNVATGPLLGSIGIDSEYASLLQTQMHFQEQMQLVSLHSNIEKSKHETRMSAVRNVRSA